MKKWKEIVVVIGVGVGVLFLTREFYRIFPLINKGYLKLLSYSGNHLFLAIMLGLLFGSISCPVCGVPLFSYAIGGEECKVKRVITAGILFNMSRFIVFLIIGWIGGIIGEIALRFKLNTIAPGITIFVGCFLILLAMDLFGIIEIKKYVSEKVMKLLFPRIAKKLPLNHPVEYLLWGGVIGVVCVLEGFSFLMPIWVGKGVHYNLVFRLVCVLVFCICAFIPPLVMLGMCGIGVEVLVQKMRKKETITMIKYIGGVVLVILGIQYILLSISNQ